MGVGGLWFAADFAPMEVSKSKGKRKGSSYSWSEGTPIPDVPVLEKRLGSGCWEFLERNLPHSDPGSGKVPSGNPGGVGSAPELGGSLKANTDPTRIRELLTQGGAATHPWARTRSLSLSLPRDGTTQDAGAHLGSGSPSPLGNFIPLYPRVPHPWDEGSWLGRGTGRAGCDPVEFSMGGTQGSLDCLVWGSQG